MLFYSSINYVTQKYNPKTSHGLELLKLGLLTFEVLPGSSQQLIKNVEGTLIFGLTNSSGFFQ